MTPPRRHRHDRSPLRAVSPGEGVTTSFVASNSTVSRETLPFASSFRSRRVCKATSDQAAQEVAGEPRDAASTGKSGTVFLLRNSVASRRAKVNRADCRRASLPAVLDMSLSAATRNAGRAAANAKSHSDAVSTSQGAFHRRRSTHADPLKTITAQRRNSMPSLRSTVGSLTRGLVFRSSADNYVVKECALLAEGTRVYEMTYHGPEPRIYQEAVALFRQAIVRDPQQPAAYFALGVAYKAWCRPDAVRQPRAAQACAACGQTPSSCATRAARC